MKFYSLNFDSLNNLFLKVPVLIYAIKHWYSGEDYQVERIEVGASVLINTQVEQLVSVMASYDVPNGVGNIIPSETQDALQPVLASTWQAA